MVRVGVRGRIMARRRGTVRVRVSVGLVWGGDNIRVRVYVSAPLEVLVHCVGLPA